MEKMLGYIIVYEVVKPLSGGDIELGLAKGNPCLTGIWLLPLWLDKI